MQEVKIHVGCTGFNYEDWKSNLGAFYPAKIDKYALLEFYSTQFTTCEINSTFYAFPKLETTARWNKSLPDDFVLTAKIPKSICQADNLSVVEQNLKSFLHIMSPLKEKLGPLVMQLKPSFEKTAATREQIYNFISFFPHSDYQLVIEFRHNSWYNEDTYNLLNEKDIGIVSSFLPYIKFNLFDEVKKDYFYLRIIGSYQQTIGLGKELRDRTNLIEKTVDQLADAYSKNTNKSTGFVFINNHFSGFAPPAARKFKELFAEKNLIPLEPKKTTFKGQQKLADFFG